MAWLQWLCSFFISIEGVLQEKIQGNDHTIFFLLVFG